MRQITDLQQARAIINKAGEEYQSLVISLLREITYYRHSNDEAYTKAQKVIENMEEEYALNVANVLWEDKFEEIPDYVKTYGKKYL